MNTNEWQLVQFNKVRDMNFDILFCRKLDKSWKDVLQVIKLFMMDFLSIAISK